VASGGEVSRLMLALKNIAAMADGIPTLVFDEVDTGISGKMALAVAQKLAQIACSRQVICVTHSAQIAAMGDRHLCIQKHVQGDVTRTQVHMLQERERIEEIARQCGVSEGYFRRLFREYSGENPIDFRQKRRIEKARQMLLMDTFTIGEIAQELHFTDIYHFSKTFKKYCGVSPSRYLQSEK